LDSAPTLAMCSIILAQVLSHDISARCASTALSQGAFGRGFASGFGADDVGVERQVKGEEQEHA